MLMGYFTTTEHYLKYISS